MASKLGDIADLSFQFINTKPSSAVITSVTSAGVDMIAHDNNVFAIQAIGTVAGTEITFVGKIQEATTQTGTYTDISGAVFSTVTSTTGVPAIQAITFQRNMQFIRYVGTIAGTTSAVALDVMAVGQKKQVS